MISSWSSNRPSPTASFTFAGASSLPSWMTFSRGGYSTRYNANGLIELINTTTPQLDYDPATLAPRGVGIWKQSTNMELQNTNFDISPWGKSNCTVTVNAATSPDGTNNACKILETAVNSFFAVNANPSGASFSTKYTWSCYAKAAERNFLTFNFSVVGAVGYCDLTTGAFTITGSGGSPVTSSQYVGNGWWRVVVTFTTPASGINLLYHIIGVSKDTSGSYLGDPTKGIYVYGSQLEAGDIATPLIFTTTVQVTRSQDLLSITGSGLSGFYNSSESTFVVEYMRPYTSPATSNGVVFMASNGTVSNRVGVVVNGGSSVISPVASSGGSNYGIGITGNNMPAAYVIRKSALGIKQGTGNGQFCTNGSAGSAGNITTWPPSGAIDRITIGSGPTTSTDSWNGYIRKIDYYNSRLSVNQLKALSV